MAVEELLVIDAEAEEPESGLEFFVTGCSGFIGTHLVTRLLDSGHTVLLPETLQLFVEAAGFVVEAVEPLHPFPAEERLAGDAPLMPAADPGLAAVASEVRRLELRLDELLNGPRDFVLRARKPEPGRAG